MSKLCFAIRNVVPEDYLECLQMFKEMGERYTLDPADEEIYGIFQQYTMHQKKLGFVAYEVETEQILGCLFIEIGNMLCKSGKQGRGEGMVIKPQFRGNGVGRSLLDNAAEILKQRGVPDFVVRAPTSWPSIDFYRSLPQLEERGVYFYYKFNKV